MPTTEKMPLLLRAWLAITGTCVAASLLGHMLIGLNTDHIDLMDQVNRWLSGGTPYVAYADVNPPLIHLLYVLPALLSRLTGLAPHISLYLEVYAIMAASLWCCWRVLEGCTASARWLSVSTVALALCGTSFLNQVFADREHLFLCFIAPWLVLHAPFLPFAHAPVRWRRVAAVLAALGIALKPYFLLVYFAAMLGSLRRLPLAAQLRMREHHIIWFMGVVYDALISLCFPVYVSEVGPLVWHTYPYSAWALESRLAVAKQLLVQYWPVWLWAAAGAYLLRGHIRASLFYLLGLQLAALALYLLNAGWWYTQYPFQAINLCLLVLSASALVSLASGFKRMLLVWLLPAFVASLYYLHMVPAIDRASTDIRSQRVHGRPIATYSMTPAAAEEIAPLFENRQRYLFFSTNLRALSLLDLKPGLQSIGRYDHLWPLPAFAKWPEGKDPALKSWLLDLFVNGLIDDIRTGKPELIIVDASAYHPPLPSGFKLMPFFEAHPGFAAAMKPYKRIKQVNACRDNVIAACGFDIYGLK